MAVEKSWYTKYRPKTMNDYLGDGIKNIVARRFTKKENMPHVIFVHGSRGCGKTTFARIISKRYMCLNPNDDGTPCEECDMCTSINEILIDGEAGNVECPGVYEIDATVMNGKDDIQEVLDNAVQQPIYSDYKVLIIDEVHMVSKAAQNSMLKILEDIPSHLIVIFCTTNPEKVLQTIKSRCQLTLEVKKQTVKDLIKRLSEIAELENLKVSSEALEIIAKKANRVPRESINLLETIAKTYDGEVIISNVKDYLTDISSDIYIDYFKSANSSLADILIFIKKLKDNDIKIDSFVNGLMQFVLDSLYIKHAISLDEYPKEYIKSIKELFEIYTSSDFDVLLQIVEYLIHNTSSEDSAKNEILLTTTAMRISKIQLLAKGLTKESNEAITENKISIYEHSKKLKADNNKIVEQLKFEMTKEDMSDTFEHTKQILNTTNLFDSLEIPSVQFNEVTIDSKENTIEKEDSVLDSFFDN